jgi:hypothetical protein
MRIALIHLYSMGQPMFSNYFTGILCSLQSVLRELSCSEGREQYYPIHMWKNVLYPRCWGQLRSAVGFEQGERLRAGASSGHVTRDLIDLRVKESRPTLAV